jgi:hypothetical protein
MLSPQEVNIEIDISTLNRNGEGFECSHINNIGKGCSTILIFPFIPYPNLNPNPAKSNKG